MSLTMLDTLLSHDRWATTQILDACASLTDQQLDRTFEMGSGCVRATLIHMFGAARGWHQSIEPVDAIPMDPHSSIAAMRPWHERIADDLERFARAEPLSATVIAKKPPRTLTIPRAVLFSHLLTHTMHHRGQLLNMLRHLGVSPLPQSSVMQWSLGAGVAQMTVDAT